MNYKNYAYTDGGAIICYGTMFLLVNMLFLFFKLSGGMMTLEISGELRYGYVSVTPNKN